MSLAQVLALASGPVIVLLHVVWSVDKNREPLWTVLKYLLVGALVLVPGCAVEGVTLGWLGDPLADPGTTPLLELFVASMIAVALVEEIVKYAGLRLVAGRDRHLDEPFDWVVYAVTVSLGFALVENILYVVERGSAVAIPRALFAVPAHALCGTLMGVRLALAARAEGSLARRQRVLALVEPVLWHGVYDFLAFASTRPSDGLLFDGLFGLLVLAHWARCVNAVRGLLVPEAPIPPVLYPLAKTRFVRRPGA